ncbi:nuclear transport factor 2 family protein [Rheinheimera sp. F8]|uniref:nuclear transport factor 2 family protein n=1 Tax=Rheinheimera sp. F8 TaxID=1763998 RepID=UPI000744CE76|nr:nuclear transport factor 2 family protein [Rheinheimera sp. F8]ALZ75278.1 hypothetical protein ATY27_05590 [Rheinheimera sp. F8]ALZ76296.1 hypothetical protein ATY27_11355 [Rheinheimera sp. F8]
MTIELPESIKQYFSAGNIADLQGLQDCFTKDAVVFDEGGAFRGLAAIAAWFSEARQKYQFSATPLSITTKDQHQLVLASVSGNFPGSPIQLQYAFLLHDDKIQSLQISSS